MKQKQVALPLSDHVWLKGFFDYVSLMDSSHFRIGCSRAYGNIWQLEWELRKRQARGAA